MTNQIPMWALYLQALSAPVIALLAAVIGVIQWRTAHQRAVLDLFDRRMQNYDALNAAVAEIMREGNAALKALVPFSQAAARARFLFGGEVTAYLEETEKRIISLRAAEGATKTEDDEKRARAADLAAKHLMTLTEFFDRLTSLVRPYMRQHQKAPWF
jgi:hypothetical protein